MKSLLTLCTLFLALSLPAQKSYTDSLKQFQQDYAALHEVVKGNDKKHLSFYPVNEKFRVVAHIEKKENSPWFLMETSGPMKKTYRVYAVARFILNDTVQYLNIYQSQSLLQTEEYRNHLFLPFTDATSGVDTYINGRYCDLFLDDIRGNELVIDFNKAYNPYCAYVSGVYNCPIPPRENRLSVAIRAGEKSFSGQH